MLQLIDPLLNEGPPLSYFWLSLLKSIINATASLLNSIMNATAFQVDIALLNQH